MATYTGTVSKVTSDKSCKIQTSAGPPPIEVSFLDLSADQYAIIVAAWGSGKSVTVTGTPPSATKVESV